MNSITEGHIKPTLHVVPCDAIEGPIAAFPDPHENPDTHIWYLLRPYAHWGKDFADQARDCWTRREQELKVEIKTLEDASRAQLDTSHDLIREQKELREFRNRNRWKKPDGAKLRQRHLA